MLLSRTKTPTSDWKRYFNLMNFCVFISSDNCCFWNSRFVFQAFVSFVHREASRRREKLDAFIQRAEELRKLGSKISRKASETEKVSPTNLVETPIRDDSNRWTPHNKHTPSTVCDSARSRVTYSSPFSSPHSFHSSLDSAGSSVDVMNDFYLRKEVEEDRDASSTSAPITCAEASSFSVETHGQPCVGIVENGQLLPTESVPSHLHSKHRPSTPKQIRQMEQRREERKLRRLELQRRYEEHEEKKIVCSNFQISYIFPLSKTLSVWLL